MKTMKKRLHAVDGLAAVAVLLMWTVGCSEQTPTSLGEPLAGVPTLATSGSDCTVTVTAPASIQAAVNTASSGDVICLEGIFNQSVTIPVSASGITLTAAALASPVLDGATLAGTGPTSINGITLASGVSGVTIEDLEIKNFKGNESGNDRSSAIVAANGNTSNITIEDNYLHDNFWNGLLVFSNGVPTNHTNWTVEDNTATGNGFVNIELTNCSGCTVEDNEVSGSGRADIVIQARNTVASNPAVTVSNVLVKDNESSGAGAEGIFLLALGTGPLPPFPTIVNGGALLQNVVVEENEVDNAGITGIRILGFTGGSVTTSNVLDNEVEDSGTWGIRVQELAGGTAGGNTLSENEVEDSGTFDCIDNTSDTGTAGTANTWTDNEGVTSSPAGLCEDD